MARKNYVISIKGDKILCHNGQTCDPLNVFAKGLKVLSSKRKKTDADIERMAVLELQSTLYVNDCHECVLSSFVLESALLASARRSKEGRQAASGLIVETDLVLKINGKSITESEVLKGGARGNPFAFTRPVRIGQSRVMRTRALFCDWSGSFTVSIDENMVQVESLHAWVETMMNEVGICDWRPRFGRGQVVSVEAVKSASPLKKIA